MSSPTTESTRERILRVLTEETSPFLEEGVGLAVDHILERTLTELVDLEEAAGLVVRGLTEKNLARAIQRHVQPGFQRYASAAESTGEVVGALVPDPARDKIRQIVQKSSLPRAEWAEGLVDPALVRKLFAPVWVQLLLTFGTRLPLPGMGAASGAAAAVGRGMGGIAGRLTRSVQERAEKIADAGRTVMGGIGAEVEKRIQAAARDFSDGAAEIFRDALRDRLKSQEGRNLVEQITSQVIDRVMTTKLTDIQKDVNAIDVDGIFGVVPDIVAHAAPGSFVRGIVEGEVKAYLALEGNRTLVDLLSEMGLYADVRTALIRRATLVARGFFGSPKFEDFLGRLLDA
jgi:hypothetical protein